MRNKDTGPAFGELLRRYREAAGLTQEALAERAGLSARGISDLERVVIRAPRTDTLGLLIRALGLTTPERTRLEAAARGHDGVGAAAADAGDRSPDDEQPPLVGRAAEHREESAPAACGPAGPDGGLAGAGGELPTTGWPGNVCPAA